MYDTSMYEGMLAETVSIQGHAGGSWHLPPPAEGWNEAA